jgi:hypothetical protein
MAISIALSRGCDAPFDTQLSIVRTFEMGIWASSARIFSRTPGSSASGGSRVRTTMSISGQTRATLE